MREIKFRAWDKDAEEMLQVDAIALAENVFEWGPGVTDQHNDFHPMGDVELMQYTGLKDKNGVELYYDSDIVRLGGNYFGEYHPGKEWLWMATKDDFDIPHFLPAHGAFGVNLPFEQIFMGSRRDCFEIVGNRFENPDLIDQPVQADLHTDPTQNNQDNDIT